MNFPVPRGRYGTRRFDPFGGLPGFEGLFDQMSRMLTSAFPDVARIHVNSWSPPVDVHESEDAYVVEADVPGVPPEDVRVDLEGRELSITGEYGTVPVAGQQTQQESQQQAQAGVTPSDATQEQNQQGTQQQGRSAPQRTGRFDYRVTLPGEVRSEAATANLEHGVLRLTLPKVSSGARQRIQVQAGSSASTRLQTGPSTASSTRTEGGSSSSQASSS